jgi:acyl CoA:acetate/3-ketoacid CoA transferase beta subunit
MVEPADVRDVDESGPVHEVIAKEEYRLDYLADQWTCGDGGFIGIGSGGRAHVLATLLPIASAVLANMRDKNVRVQIGPLLGVDLSAYPPTFYDSKLYQWQAEGFLETEMNLMFLEAGKIDIGFVSCAQIDIRGRINVNEVIGKSGRVRLGGALAVPELASRPAKTMVLIDLDPRAFVDHVDFVTGLLVPQTPKGESEMSQQGISKQRAIRVVTDVCVFDVTGDGPKIVEIFPGHSLEEIEARISWRVSCAEHLTTNRKGVSIVEADRLSKWMTIAESVA